MKILVIVGLVLFAGAGCDASGEMGGDPNQRGDVDAGGAAGSSATGAGGSAGAAGAPAAGGRTGAGGAMASTGGSAGSLGGATGSAGGSGGSSTTTAPCDAYGWSGFGYSVCSKQVSAGVFQHGSKDGHPCAICGPPARPSGVPECTAAGSQTVLCVLSCDECTFQ